MLAMIEALTAGRPLQASWHEADPEPEATGRCRHWNSAGTEHELSGSLFWELRASYPNKDIYQTKGFSITGKINLSSLTGISWAAVTAPQLMPGSFKKATAILYKTRSLFWQSSG